MKTTNEKARLEKFANDVKKDLQEMKRLGVSVPAGAFKQARPEVIKEYDGMSVSDCADLLIQLAQISE